MPEPSQLVLLEQLHSIAPGSKVRFLACVYAYDGQRAQATMKRNYPATNPDVPAVIVNMENVLENVNHELLEIGAWLNVVGYVEKAPGFDKTKPVISKDAERETQPLVLVAATMIWSAGAIRLDRYESAVQGYQKQLVPG